MSDGIWVKPKNVIVTGGTGFVGVFLCRALAERGDAPLAVGIETFSEDGLFTLGPLATRVKFIHCDIRDAEKLDAICADNPVDAIIHVAGYVGVEATLANPALTYAVNVGGTVNILEVARKAGIQKVVIVSSNAAYHNREHPVFDESHPTTSISRGSPNAHYGTSKMAAEQIGLTYHTHHQLDVVIARITAVYGLGMRSAMFIKPLVEGAVRGAPVAIPTGAAMGRDYTYIDDAVSGILALLDTDTRSFEQRIYNFSRGELVSAAEIAEVVRKLVPGADLSVGTELTPLEQVNVYQRAPLSSEAAERVFGFHSHYSIEQGTKAYVEDYRNFLKSQHQEGN